MRSRRLERRANVFLESRRAASTRTRSTKRPGVMPTSRTKTRKKCAASCSPGAERLHGEVGAGWSRTPGLHLAERLPIGHLRGELDAELRLPPGRLRKTTIHWATARASDGQRFSSPAPAPRSTPPWRRRMCRRPVANVDGVRLHPDAGKRRASSSQKAQCVVAVRPSQSPPRPDERPGAEPDNPRVRVPWRAASARGPDRASASSGPSTPVTIRCRWGHDGAIQRSRRAQPRPGAHRLDRRYHLDGVATSLDAPE